MYVHRPSTATALALLLVAVLFAAGCARSAASDTAAPAAGSTTAPTTGPTAGPTAGSTTGLTSDPTTVPTTGPSAPTTTVIRPTADVDELVPVGGGRLHVTCTGHGDRTVLVLPGFTDPGDSWTDLTPAIAAKARVCSYSRFGLGTSDQPPGPQTFATQARDLRSALDALHEPGPYVVVGHSFGGPEAVTFTAQNTADVHGLLLLDASPPAWHDASCAVPDDGSAKAKEFALSCAMTHTPAANPEALDGPAAFAAVASIDTLGDVPMVVATAPHDYPGLAADQVERLHQVWDDGQQHWLTLSTSSRLLPVERSGHVIQVDRPDVVLEQLDQLLP